VRYFVRQAKFDLLAWDSAMWFWASDIESRGFSVFFGKIREN